VVFGTAIAFRHTGFFQHEGERTEVGQAALRQIRAYEHGQPDPDGINEVRQGDAEQNHKAGHQVNDFIYGHDYFLS
jgi:hypothetical protein